MAGFSSMLIFTSFTLPFKARTTFSSTGVSCLQGPHQGAQKSTSTGTAREASITSLTKPAVLESLISSPWAPASGARDLPSPNTIVLSVPCCKLPRLARPREGNDARLVTTGAQEDNEVVARDIRRCRVLQRMAIEPVVTHHIGIEDDRHAPGPVIDESER